MASFLQIVTLCSAICIILAAKLPATFDRCHVSPELDNKNNECLRKAIAGAIRILADKGSPEISAADLDPMVISDIKIQQGDDKPVAINLHFKNVVITGLSNFELTSVGGKISSPQGFHMVARGSAPILTLSGPYKIVGKVLVLPIRGEGLSNMTLFNPKVISQFYGEPETRNGKTYLKVKRSTLSLEPENMYMHMDNLFDGNQTLGDSTNRFVNNNWKQIYGDVRKPIEEAFAAVFKEYSKRVFGSVAFNDIFVVDE